MKAWQLLVVSSLSLPSCGTWIDEALTALFSRKWSCCQALALQLLLAMLFRLHLLCSS